jgi:hypothetical protein
MFSAEIVEEKHQPQMMRIEHGSSLLFSFFIVSRLQRKQCRCGSYSWRHRVNAVKEMKISSSYVVYGERTHFQHGNNMLTGDEKSSFEN